MPALSWNEIRQRAIQFSREWKGEQNERPESQTFWNEFFWVFGIRRRAVAAFEVPVKSSLKNTYHRIDLFWEGTLLAEHKSAGANLDRAESQAFLYIRELIKAGREEEAPPYVILSDFNRLVLYNLEPEAREEGRIEFPLSDLHDYIKHFAFLIGQKPLKFGEQDEVNLKAAALMANLHICVANDNYPIEDLERLLVRLLFCLFAEDTGIFDRLQFELFIKKRTRDDASDLGPQLNTLFEV
ncbi:MAG TPA: class I SAM-dependent DNA methyltransferase, partial [Candidatus Sumerlaeota bacterium]|nr:class I SAM-dependent DNA methyltransferase [Candidatus Sumerlaeota bacterium]